MFDEKLPGFGLRSRAGGKRTWIVQYRVGRKQRRKTLGSVDKDDGHSRPAARPQNDLANVHARRRSCRQRKAETRARAAETLEVISARFLARQQDQASSRAVMEQVETAPDEALGAVARAARIHDNHSARSRGPAWRDRRRPGAWPLCGQPRARNAFDFLWLGNERGACRQQPGHQHKSPSGREVARDRVLTDAELVAIWKACRG